MNLTRYQGVLAPNHRWRGLVTPAKRGNNCAAKSIDELQAAMAAIKESLKIARQEYEQVRGELDELLNIQYKKLLQALETAQVSWTPGRHNHAVN